MLALALQEAIDAACPATIADVTTRIWTAFARSEITEAESEELSARIEARKGRAPVNPSAPRPPKRLSIFPPRKAQKPRDPSAAVKRRRENSRHAMSPKMSNGFTNGQLSVFLIVAQEYRDKGSCDRSIAEIGARAGAGRTLVQAALKLAQQLGLIIVQRRPQKGRKNLTNVIRIVSKEWMLWIKRGVKAAANAIGSVFSNLMDNKKINKKGQSPYRPFERTSVLGRSTDGRKKGSGMMRC